MKKIFVIFMLLASTSAHADLDRTRYPSDLECEITKTSGKSEVRKTLLTSTMPAHVINEEIGKNHVLSILLSGDAYPQTYWVKLFSNQFGEVFSVVNDTYNMCDSIEIHGDMKVEDIAVSYSCKVICSNR